jgi:hypothetical protein
MLGTVGTWGVGPRIPRAVKPANGLGCDGVSRMLLTTLHRIGSEPTQARDPYGQFGASAQ